MNYYEAKFAREAKPRPTDWLIIEGSRGFFKLIQVAA